MIQYKMYEISTARDVPQKQLYQLKTNFFKKSLLNTKPNAKFAVLLTFGLGFK